MYLIYFLRDGFCHICSFLFTLMYLYISNEFGFNV